MSLPPIERLSNELLRLILDQIEPDPDNAVPIDDRRFLSVESFIAPLSSKDSVRDIGRFRSTCKRFADVGAPLLFTHVSARLSKGGLQKLETLSGWSHLTHLVKKFSYLVPYFYQPGKTTSPISFNIALISARRAWSASYGRERPDSTHVEGIDEESKRTAADS